METLVHLSPRNRHRKNLELRSTLRALQIDLVKDISRHTIYPSTSHDQRRRLVCNLWLHPLAWRLLLRLLELVVCYPIVKFHFLRALVHHRLLLLHPASPQPNQLPRSKLDHLQQPKLAVGRGLLRRRSQGLVAVASLKNYQWSRNLALRLAWVGSRRSKICPRLHHPLQFPRTFLRNLPSVLLFLLSNLPMRMRNTNFNPLKEWTLTQTFLRLHKMDLRLLVWR